MGEPKQCSFCGRYFTGRSVPKWVFRMDGHSMGIAHASCAPVMTRGKRGLSIAGGQSERDARYEFWKWYVRPRPKVGGEWSDEDYAAVLGTHLDEMTDYREEELLNWWRVGPMKLEAERIERIRQARLDLIRRFTEWEATL